MRILNSLIKYINPQYRYHKFYEILLRGNITLCSLKVGSFLFDYY